MRKSVLAVSLVLAMLGAQAQQPRETVAQLAIPDAPKPQTNLPVGQVAPGQGTTSSTEDGTATGAAAPSAPAPAAANSGEPPAAPGDYTPAGGPDVPAGQGVSELQKIVVHVNFVNLAFTVKDSKGKLVPGLTSRDVQVFENGERQRIAYFTNDALPMSVALVIDQGMTRDEMTLVNDALGALPDAFSKYDEVAVFTYNKNPKKVTDFTAATSARLTQAIETSKTNGRDPVMAGSLSGPLSQTTVINNQNFDPNTSAVRGQAGPGIQLNPEREYHPLNDAILEAATALSTRPLGRRRVIYVISNGNEYGSMAKMSQVKQYLAVNGVEVDGTLVGDSALPVIGFLDKLSLPMMMRDNALISYVKATGGNLDSEFRLDSIEKSFARVASEARNRYTVGYYTHEPFLDGKYRATEIRVLHPNLTVIAPHGYFPSAMEYRPRSPIAPLQ